MHARARDGLPDLGDEQLRRRGLVIGEQPPVLHRDDAEREVVANLRLDVAVGELRPHRRREPGLRLALVRAQVVAQDLEAVAQRDRAGDVRTLVVEQRHPHVPAAVDLAEHVVGGGAHVLEEGLVEAVLPAHVDQRADGEAGGVDVGHEHEGDAAVLGRVRIRPHEGEERVRVVGVRGPDLLPVDHPLVAVAHRPRLERREVGAGARLRVALCPYDLAREDARQEALLLLVRAVHDQRRAEQREAVPADLRRAGTRALLGEDELLHRGEPGAAVLPRPMRGEPAPFGECRAPLLGGLAPLGVVGRPIGDPVAFLPARLPALVVVGRAVLDQRPRLAAERGLLLAVRPVHGDPVSAAHRQRWRKDSSPAAPPVGRPGVRRHPPRHDGSAPVEGGPPWIETAPSVVSARAARPRNSWPRHGGTSRTSSGRSPWGVRSVTLAGVIEAGECRSGSLVPVDSAGIRS